nr:hypothetical protein RAR13_20205 [Aminobacter aminovorans]
MIANRYRQITWPRPAELALRLALSLGVATTTGSSIAKAAGQTALPPDAYCKALKKYDAIQSQADEKFGSDGSQWAKRNEWVTAHEDKLNKQLATQLKMPSQDLAATASEQHWQLGCEAKASGWLAIGQENLTRVPNDHVSRVKDAIVLEYVKRLDRGPKDQFFDPERYSAVHCEDAAVGGYHFVGCKLRAIGAETDPDIYVVADIDGTASAVPYDSEAKGRIKGATKLASGDQAVPLGFYVGPLPLVDYSDVRSQVD